MTLDILIRTTPPEKMRYDTCGDWFFDTNSLHITVAEQDDPRQEMLVAIHELVEALLCQHKGITTTMVDDFDFAYTGVGEPGEHPDCPYQEEHLIAEGIERIMAAQLMVNFEDYLGVLAASTYGTAEIGDTPTTEGDGYEATARNNRIW